MLLGAGYIAKKVAGKIYSYIDEACGTPREEAEKNGKAFGKVVGYGVGIATFDPVAAKEALTNILLPTYGDGRI